MPNNEISLDTDSNQLQHLQSTHDFSIFTLGTSTNQIFHYTRCKKITRNTVPQQYWKFTFKEITSSIYLKRYKTVLINKSFIFLTV